MRDDPNTAPWGIVSAEFVAGAKAVAQLPATTGVEIAFAGRSNVGKSSVMNALMGRRNLVRTSSTPGCTRQISFFQTCARDGREQVLVDLPGYGYARRSKTERDEWAELIEHYVQQRPTLRAVAVLFDARRGMEEEEEGLCEFIATRPAEHAATLVLVATKIDKLPKSKRQAALARLGRRAYPVSATEGDGIGALWTELRRATLPAAPDEP
ncbi:MAG: ribosome biogenesis GTP-binding protein YsxC [Myxococcales bacterium]|nr:ribosome biogenesis GTP-binding protein YsxC [Myxococcales bacterium]